MAEPTLDELVAFMKKHGVEKVDSITDEKSAIKHFRAASRVYKEERDSFRKQRDELINDMAEVKRKAKAYDKIKEAADFEKLNDCSLYDNDSFIDRLHHVFDEMRVNHEG
ncbi:hypothetical protein RJB92_01310 [Staphylococcus hominis]|uniref:hypothetical protein n=1 Tax=Staphylococcus hominis TaxID=1290 RepID=UPI0028791ED2|nr:hypothetical protein [Staphylococcus hominis]MDS3866873.1 hypothetical protein [Staphylococcus hominis]